MKNPRLSRILPKQSEGIFLALPGRVSKDPVSHWPDPSFQVIRRPRETMRTSSGPVLKTTFRTSRAISVAAMTSASVVSREREKLPRTMDGFCKR